MCCDCSIEQSFFCERGSFFYRNRLKKDDVMTKNSKQSKQIRGKVIYGTTTEERFKEIYGMTFEQWKVKGEERFKAKTGMSSDEWYIKQVTTLTPIDYFQNRNGVVTQEDVELVKDLQELGLNDGVIYVLLDYVKIISKIDFFHALVKEMGKSWCEENILSIESAMAFVREEWKNQNL